MSLTVDWPAQGLTTHQTIAMVGLLLKCYLPSIPTPISTLSSCEVDQAL